MSRQSFVSWLVILCYFGGNLSLQASWFLLGFLGNFFSFFCMLITGISMYPLFVANKITMINQINKRGQQFSIVA